MYGQISCICLDDNEGRECKTKDSVYNMHLNFRTFLSRKKSAHYTRVNKVTQWKKKQFWMPFTHFYEYEYTKFPLTSFTIP